jgi:membrane associated rhomboid family serine protease
MIFPLRDDIRRQSWPVVTVGLIGLNVLAFLYQVSLGIDGGGPGPRAAEAFIVEFGATPCRLTHSCPSSVARLLGDFPHPWATIFTSMFLHANLLHIGANMLFLWIFGNSVEDTIGHARFVLFYLAAGVVAAVGQSLVTPTSSVPMIGASGAVSGVLGAYLLLFPQATVQTLVMLGFFIKVLRIPVLLFLGFWVLLQLVNGYLSYRASYGARVGGGGEGGVAWFAHIGGFLGGIILLFLLRPRQSRRL